MGYIEIVQSESVRKQYSAKYVFQELNEIIELLILSTDYINKEES